MSCSWEQAIRRFETSPECARNPKTDEPVQFPATHYPTFRAGKTPKVKVASYNKNSP
ncbi:MAG: HU family DNA-binding protein [Clostridium sp.]|nr:HU family DNA-binding protein [Clostridium sp.]